VDFDGTNDYITVADTSTLDFGDGESFTLSAWFYRDTSGTYDSIIVKRNDATAASAGYDLIISNALNLAQFSVSDGTDTYYFLSNTAFTTPGWYHIAVTWDDSSESNTKLYVNAVNDTVSRTGTFASIGSLANAIPLGIGTYNGGHMFDGKIDEARVYNRALSPDEIGQLYRLTAPTGTDTSLKGYWSFNGNDISGTTAYDRSGAGNTGTLTNGPIKTVGPVGQALSFDGTDDYVTAADSSALRITGAQTISFWIKSTDTTAGLVSKSDVGAKYFGTAGAKVYEIGIQSGTIYYQIGDGTTSTALSGSATPIVDGTWHHIVCTWDGTTGANGMKLYRDSVLLYQATSAVSAIRTATEALDIGGWTGASAVPLLGSLDEVRIYNRALSATEVKGLFDTGDADEVNSSRSQSQGTGRLDSGLAGYWKMDDGSGTSATDSSTNGITGTLTNGPTWTTGQIGGAVDLDGTDDYINLSTTHNYTSQDFSISHWAKFDSLTTEAGGQGPVTIYKGAYQVNGYYVQVSTTGSVIFFTNQSGANQTSSTPTGTIVTGNWYHMTYVRKGASVRIYINGVDSTTTVGTHSNPTSSGSNLEFGRYSSTIEMNGQVDELRVYDRVLSADEVAQLYRLTAPTGVDTSLKGYWSFNAPDMASTTAYDRSGVGNTGTLTNSPTKASGIVGQAVDFDGTNDYVSLTDGAQFDPGGTASWCLWFYNDTALASSTALFMHDATSSRSASTYKWIAAYLTSNSTNLSTYVRIGGTAYNAVGPTLATGYYTNAWHHVCSTFDKSLSSARLKIYIDGTLSGTADATNGDIDAGGFPEIGRWEQGSGYFNGKIDEVRMYNRALTAGEIKSQYDAATPDKGNSSVSQPQGTGRLDSGLAGYWKLDDGSGTSAGDASTNANTGTLTNGPTWTTGQIGGAVNFDGTDDYIDLGDLSVTESAPALTWSLWVNPANFSGGLRSLIAKFNNDNTQTSWMVETGNANAAGLIVAIPTTTTDGSTYGEVTTAVLTVSTWNLVTVVFDGTQTGNSNRLKIYVNGVQMLVTYTGTIPSTTQATTSNARIAAKSNLTGYFPGLVDEVRLYNRALSNDEISQLYRLTAPTGTDTGLKGYWSFNGKDISGTTAYDQSGAGNNGTLTNSPTKVIGKLGQGLSFDGVDDEVSIADQVALRPGSGSWSVSVWAKPSNTSQNSGIVTKRQTSGAFEQWGVAVCGTDNCSASGKKITFIMRESLSNHRYFITTSDVADGNWHHIVAVANSGANTLMFYIDGVAVAGSQTTSGSWPTIDNTDAMKIGSSNGSNYMNGLIDEVRLYNRALSASEITTLYNSSR
jgi:hypothetical protein